MDKEITREDIFQALVKALRDLDYVHAMWQGGAAAFGRVDEWSDIDLQVDVADEHVEDVFLVIERTLESLSPIDLVYELPQPTWHGHAQRFYRLAYASPFHLVDVAVMKHSSTNKFITVERHGRARVHFDHAEVVEPPPFDWGALHDKLQARLAELRVRFDLFQTLVLKEIERGHDIDALVFYQSMTLRPLVEVLRIQLQPARHDFGPRYLYHDFPPDLVKQLEDLFFVHSLEDVGLKQQLAEKWFYQALKAAENSLADIGAKEMEKPPAGHPSN